MANGFRLQHLPYSEQKKALDGTIDVLTSTGDTLKMRVESMTSEQISQVFARDHIRDLAAQKAWREQIFSKQNEKEERSKIRALKNPVEVDRKHRCIRVHGVQLTIGDLVEYIRKLGE